MIKFWRYSPQTKKGNKLTKSHRELISLALRGNKNVLGRRWGWGEEAKARRSEQWKGKSWSPGTQWKKGQTSGPNNVNWAGGISPYPSMFSKELKLKIRTRDKFVCQLCGVREKDYFQKLTVHHIDYDKNNCKKSNLVTVCQSCNLKANVKYIRKGVTTRRDVTNRNWLKVWSELMSDHKKQEYKNLR